MELRRYLAMKGETGSYPEDYPLFQAAKWMGVPPWELAEQSIWWKERALKFMRAEVEAQQIVDEHNKPAGT